MRRTKVCEGCKWEKRAGEVSTGTLFVVQRFAQAGQLDRLHTRRRTGGALFFLLGQPLCVAFLVFLAFRVNVAVD